MDDPMSEIERVVAEAMAPTVFMPFDPKLHGSPVNRDAAQRMWPAHAQAAISAIKAAGAVAYLDERTNETYPNMKPHQCLRFADEPCANGFVETPLYRL